MDTLFIWTCFCLMWMMIFGVSLYYCAYVHVSNIKNTLILGTSTILTTTICWLFAGYSLSFYGNMSASIFNFNFDLSEVPQMMLQLLFCLYAVIMVIGSILERGNWKHALVYGPLWALLVYTPLCYALWSEGGFLRAWGVLDYSGGLVVHASAGIGSLVLATFLPKRSLKQKKMTPTQILALYLGTLLIVVGWFGFNLAPAGTLNIEAMQAWLNTLVSIIFGSLAWFISSRLIYKRFALSALLNGMIAGLVGSTASVGYVRVIPSIVIACLVCSLCPLIIFKMKEWFRFDDAVDSFGMNAIGGLIGSILVGVFAKGGSHLGVQVLGIGIVVTWSFVIAWLLNRILKLFIPLTADSDIDLGLDQSLDD